MEACTFCDIIAGRSEASFVIRTESCVAFCDLRQPHGVEHGAHILIVPRQHIETLDEMDDDSAADLMKLAVRISRVLFSEFGREGLTLWQSNGEAAFQEVPHVHLHLMTRRTKDALLQIYPELPVDTGRDNLDQLAMRIRNRLDEPD